MCGVFVWLPWFMVLWIDSGLSRTPNLSIAQLGRDLNQRSTFPLQRSLFLVHNSNSKHGYSLIFCNYDYNLYLVVDTFETSSFVIPSIYVLAILCQAVAHIDETARGGGGPSPPPGGPVDLPVGVVRIFEAASQRRILMNFLRLVLPRSSGHINYSKLQRNFTVRYRHFSYHF